jgi:hypothetical protein
METNVTIAAVIRRFDMRTPWFFRDAVAASLDVVSAKLFGEVWEEATAAAHWRQSDLGACAREASSALEQRFTFLGLTRLTSSRARLPSSGGNTSTQVGSAATPAAASPRSPRRVASDRKAAHAAGTLTRPRGERPPGRSSVGARS